MQTPFSSENSTYCNKPWQTFFDGTGISPNELWFGVVRAVYISLRIAHLRLSGRLGLCCFKLRYGSKCFRQTVPQCNWTRSWPSLLPVGGFSCLDTVNLCSLGFLGVSLLGSVHSWCPDTVPKYGTVNTTSFCADTQALVPGHHVWTAPYLGYIVTQQQPTAKKVYLYHLLTNSIICYPPNGMLYFLPLLAWNRVGELHILIWSRASFPESMSPILT